MHARKAAGAIGAFVTSVDLTAAGEDAALHRQIRSLVHEYEVLFFPDQAITPQALEAFARGFGDIEDHPAYPKVDGTAVQMLESTPESPSKIELWHSDMTFRPAPPSLTIVHGKIIPDYGGDTLWSSASAAYRALTPAMRELVDGLTAEHDFRHGFRESLAEPGGAERLREAVAANPPVTHPLVRTHPESGRRALFVNPLFTTRICELAPDESDAILAFLYQHCIRDEYTVRLDWNPNTVVVWDNAVTQHKPVNDFHPQHRLLHRLTVVGTQPV
ncbi:MAG: TauD/TfdA family dioxygenase [Pseudomonadota bacterium]